MEGKKNWRILVGVAMILCMAMPNRVEASEENSYDTNIRNCMGRGKWRTRQ